MRIHVDTAVCASHGQCEFAAPEVFGLDDDGELSYVAEPAPEEAENVERAIRACPTRAIRKVE
ncbi:ferredoxin [Actinomadura hallensis]|uniref:Ferredoxin n=1 Tax=Actinomadura hallensis TaxID=337895 RepID=A0A543I917_9ACTN|nr:ferredoxin [Actinomadura hallensis]TQM67085.1 ferredoxin [Actinomadura hallensis]HLV75384.1 ferredoxin [Vulgatibacteraceae bacterium]